LTLEQAKPIESDFMYRMLNETTLVEVDGLLIVPQILFLC